MSDSTQADGEKINHEGADGEMQTELGASVEELLDNGDD